MPSDKKEFNRSPPAPNYIVKGKLLFRFRFDPTLPNESAKSRVSLGKEYTGFEPNPAPGSRTLSRKDR